MVGATNLSSIDEQQRSNIVVAVFDSGISYPTDMKVAQSVNFVETTEEIDPFYEDVSGHGTSIASVIGAFSNIRDSKDEVTVQGWTTTNYMRRILNEK